MKQLWEFFWEENKFQMVWVPCEGPELIFGDNKPFLCSTCVLDSTLEKKSQIIVSHLVRDVVARDEWRTAHVSTH